MTSKVTKRKNVENKNKIKIDEATNKNDEKPVENKPSRYGPMPTFSYQRVWSRSVIIFGVIVYLWYTTKSGKEVSLAKQKEVLQHRGQLFACDEEYLEEIISYPNCVPKKCGRYVSDKLITSTEVDVLLRIVKKGIALGGSDGGASILDLHSGALSFGKEFVNVYTMEGASKIFNSADLKLYSIVKAKIQHAIADTFDIDPQQLYLTHPTFFSRLTNAEPVTDHDEYWHTHVDKVTYESFHYTSLLYLSDFGVDFNGGRLVWVDGSLEKPTNVTLEPRRGRVAMFTSGAENVHYVERVSSGIRYAITISFTCDVDKSINDPVAQ